MKQAGRCVQFACIKKGLPEPDSALLIDLSTDDVTVCFSTLQKNGKLVFLCSTVGTAVPSYITNAISVVVVKTGLGLETSLDTKLSWSWSQARTVSPLNWVVLIFQSWSRTAWSRLQHCKQRTGQTVTSSVQGVYHFIHKGVGNLFTSHFRPTLFSASNCQQKRPTHFYQRSISEPLKRLF